MITLAATDTQIPDATTEGLARLVLAKSSYLPFPSYRGWRIEMNLVRDGKYECCAINKFSFESFALPYLVPLSDLDNAIRSDEHADAIAAIHSRIDEWIVSQVPF